MRVQKSVHTAPAQWQAQNQLRGHKMAARINLTKSLKLSDLTFDHRWCIGVDIAIISVTGEKSGR